MIVFGSKKGKKRENMEILFSGNYTECNQFIACQYLDDYYYLNLCEDNGIIKRRYVDSGVILSKLYI